MTSLEFKAFGCVLLVDDDEVTNFVNEKLLLKYQLADHVHITSNGEEALAYIDEHCEESTFMEHCPDLVLLDINMPVMDGFQFLEQIKARSKHVKVVLLTSSDNPKDIDRAHSLPIQGYISKPLTKVKLSPFMMEN